MARRRRPQPNYYARRAEKERRAQAREQQARAQQQQRMVDGILAGIDVDALVAPLIDALNADREDDT